MISLSDLYTRCKRGEAAAGAVLASQHAFGALAVFDPRSAEPLPRPMTHLLDDIVGGKAEPRDGLHDRLWRICDHSGESLSTLFRSPNEEPRRVHETMHVRQVRELDMQSFVKLSMRPGLTVRQKLASDPHLDAVRHVMSLDLPENRLLKVCAMRLSEWLEKKADAVPLTEMESELMSRIGSWLHSDDAARISPWTNPPPNNTLLSHRDYRRVWDAWGMLERLDDETDFDWENRSKIARGFEFWFRLAALRAAGRTRLAEVPLVFDAKHLSIRPFDDAKIPIAEDRSGAPLGPILQGRLQSFDTDLPAAKPRRGHVALEKPLSAKAVCIDFSSARPHFSHNGKSVSRLQRPLAWQRWTSCNGKEKVSVGCFHADGVWTREKVETVVPLDAFLQDRHAEDILAAAFRDMAAFLKTESFDTETLVWLVPDFLNDFELELPRRALNAAFPKAEPLPRSVAATVAQIDYDEVKAEIEKAKAAQKNRDNVDEASHDYSVLVVDCVGGVVFATKLVAEYDERLVTAIPETRGIVWTRHPSVVLRDARSQRSSDPALPIADSAGNWTIGKTGGAAPIDKALLSLATRTLGYCSRMIFADKTELLLCGGFRLYAMQRTGDNVTVWREKLPSLSIGNVPVNGMYGDFTLVDDSAPTIRPLRGMSVDIPVKESFLLPENLPAPFPLRQGDKRAAIDFFVQVDYYPPQAKKVPCRLKLSYSYGEDIPYSLAFVPLENGRNLPQQISATWIRRDQVKRPAVRNFASLQFKQTIPTRLLGKEGCRRKRELTRTIDLTSWVLCESESYSPVKGVVSSPVLVNPKGQHYFFAMTNDEREIYCSENSLFSDYGIQSLSQGDEVFLAVRRFVEGNGKERFQSTMTTFSDQVITALGLTTWRNDACRIVQKDRDALTRSIASLGNPSSKSEINQTLKILGLTSWKRARTSKFGRPKRKILSLIPETIPYRHLSQITHNLEKALRSGLMDFSDSLDKIENLPATLLEDERKYQERIQYSRFLHLEDISLKMELLLSLLRVRDKTQLFPGTRISEKFVDIVDGWSVLLHKRNISLPFRLAIDVSDKPDSLYNTPDFLYALRCSLTGDDGANTISITSNDEGSDYDDV